MTTGDENWQRECYGCTEEELRRMVENSVMVRIANSTRPVIGHGESAGETAHITRGFAYGMVVMSMLSDTQEMIDLCRRTGNVPSFERARKTINQAKWIINTYWMEVE